jgi:uncharacterized double-CXXCG motif protein
MTAVFEINPDDEGWGRVNRYLVDAVHAYAMPGVRCPKCGTWATTGSLYPSVDPASIAQLGIPAEPSPVSVEEFIRLASRVQPILGKHRTLEPGSVMGPLRGRVEGRLGDFSWVNPWTPLVRESIWHLMRAQGISVIGVQAQLRSRRKAQEALVELEAVPTARLRRAIVLDPCETCGRLALSRPEHLVIDIRSLDSGVPLQRIVELPTVLLINQAFASFIFDHELTNVAVKPVTVE